MARLGHRQEQVAASIAHALRTSLACDIDDPILDDLELEDVVSAPDGTYVALFSTRGDAHEVERRLDAAAGLFRDALARALTRRKLPRVSFVVGARGERTGPKGH